MKNKFLNTLYQLSSFTENGAISNATTKSELLDYFSKSGTYRDRKLEEVFVDMGKLWSESPELTLKVIFYNRMITRKTSGWYDSETVQKGQGNRSEFRKAITWLARFQPDTLYPNLWMIPIAGTWKDLWHEELIKELRPLQTYMLIERGLEDEYNRNLLAKYLPRVRSKSNTYNERHKLLNKFAFGLMKYLKWTPVQYRKFKSSGKAHTFQKQMCARQFDRIHFNGVPGKALFQMVTNRGKDGKTTLERHNMEQGYLYWIQQQPIAKFTGYVYELMKTVNGRMTAAQKYTVDKQFNGLIQLAQEDMKIKENVWCALDTSGSMTASVADTTAFDICISLGVYFSTLNEGTFKDHVIMFDNQSKVKQLSGTFSNKVMQIRNEQTAWGSTNFQSVIEEIVRIRCKNPSIPIADFPTTLIVVSDMQFNPAGRNAQTNYDAAMRKLEAVGLPKMRIVWWWVTGRGTDFPSTLNDTGVVMIGGFDGSIISLLLGESNDNQSNGQGGKLKKSQNAYDAMLVALNQELLNQVTLE